MSEFENAQFLADACARYMFEDDAASQAMGMSIEAVTPDSAKLMMRVREDMVNGRGICHGGHIFTLADSAFAFACNAQNHAALATSCTIDFVRPAKEGDMLYAQAQARYQGRRRGVYHVQVLNQNEQIVALFTGNCSRIGHSVLPSSEQEAGA